MYDQITPINDESSKSMFKQVRLIMMPDDGAVDDGEDKMEVEEAMVSVAIQASLHVDGEVKVESV